MANMMTAPSRKSLSDFLRLAIQWLRYSWKDILTLAVIGGAALGINSAPVPFTRNFPITFNSSGDIVYPDLAYPSHRGWVISPTASGLICSIIPIGIITLAQIRIRSFWDWNNAIFGTLYTLVLTALFQCVIKILVGSYRPYWLEVCRPDVSLAAAHNATGLNGAGFQRVMFTPEVCTNPDKHALRIAMTGFPSGHSATAFAGFTFLFLWMNAKLKVWANYQPSLYWLALLLCPILGAILIAGSLTIDMAHHWYDIVGGAVLGFALAVMVYRVLYAAVWDWRYNHVPLRRDREYDYTFRSDGAYVMPHPDMWTHRDIFVRKLNWMTKSDWEKMRPERREELGKAMRASRVNGHKGPDPATLRDEQVEEAGVSYPQLAASEPLEGNAAVGARRYKPPIAGDEMV